MDEWFWIFVCAPPQPESSDQIKAKYTPERATLLIHQQARCRINTQKMGAKPGGNTAQSDSPDWVRQHLSTLGPQPRCSTGMPPPLPGTAWPGTGGHHAAHSAPWRGIHGGAGINASTTCPEPLGSWWGPLLRRSAGSASPAGRQVPPPTSWGAERKRCCIYHMAKTPPLTSGGGGGHNEDPKKT